MEEEYSDEEEDPLPDTPERDPEDPEPTDEEKDERSLEEVWEVWEVWDVDESRPPLSQDEELRFEVSECIGGRSC